MKAEKALLVGAFSIIVQLRRLIVYSTSPHLGAPEVVAVVVEAGVDLEVRVGGLEVAGEGFEVGELLLELGAEEEAADLDPGVGHQTRVGRPRVQVRVVVTWQRELIH